jgi:hypothetical protein
MHTRFLFVALIASLALAGCSKNNSEQSTTSATAAAPTNPPATVLTHTKITQRGTSSALMAQLPVYPGATRQGGGHGIGTGAASVQALSTSDPFSSVYKWYQSKMPAGSEKSHVVSTDAETAIFMITSGAKRQTVTIAKFAKNPTTLITLAQTSL